MRVNKKKQGRRPYKGGKLDHQVRRVPRRSKKEVTLAKLPWETAVGKK